MPATYYLTWPDRVITLIVVARGPRGRDEVKLVGRRDRFVAVLGREPFPTADADIQLLALKVGAKVKRH